jgi:hypothetical protein
MRHRFVLVPADLETTLLMVILPATLSTTSGCHRRECEGTRNVSPKQIVANVLAPKGQWLLVSGQMETVSSIGTSPGQFVKSFLRYN